MEVVECLQGIEIGKRIRRVGVSHQLDVRILTTDRRQDFQIPSRLDLELDAVVAGIEFASDVREQLFGACLDTQRNTTIDLPVDASDQLPEWYAFGLSFN